MVGLFFCGIYADWMSVFDKNRVALLQQIFGSGILLIVK